MGGGGGGGGVSGVHVSGRLGYLVHWAPRLVLPKLSATVQWCARLGGVWDDSDMSQAAIGGTCLDSWQAGKRLQEGEGALEEVVVGLSHDTFLQGAPHSFPNTLPSHRQCAYFMKQV